MVAKLRYDTPDAWLDVVLADFDTFLLDHAACERKASATAMVFVSHYPDKTELVDAMIEMAREELEHFHRVHRLLVPRGLVLGQDTKNPYVNRLLKEVRRGTDEYFLDRLLLTGIIESRGCERFGMVARGLPPGELKDFYLDITRSESRHHMLFVRFARQYFPADVVTARLDELLDIEAAIIRELPLRPAVH